VSMLTYRMGRHSISTWRVEDDLIFEFFWISFLTSDAILRKSSLIVTQLLATIEIEKPETKSIDVLCQTINKRLTLRASIMAMHTDQRDQLPVPMSGRTCGLPDALSLMATLPCLIPFELGLKLTFM